MEINGWRLYKHKLFARQYDKLLTEAEHIRAVQPANYKKHNSIKFLTRVTQLISEEIPADPAHDRFNQGNTLGVEYRHWKRAKFGRYRLFFRYDRTKKIIVYAWINDETTLRKEGDKNDPYALFAKGLKRGQPPDTIEHLLKESQDLEAGKMTM